MFPCFSRVCNRCRKEICKPSVLVAFVLQEDEKGTSKEGPSKEKARGGTEKSLEQVRDIIITALSILHVTCLFLLLLALSSI